jgi:hypothetical protein
MNNIAIILTSSVQVQKKSWLFQTDKQERIDTYMKSIKKWLEETSFKIILVENTGYAFPEIQDYLNLYSTRFEFIGYNEFQIKEAGYLNGNNSKGASELFAIYYAYKKSNILNKSNFIIKVTCRFFIPGLEKYLISITNDINKSIDDYEVLTQNNVYRCEMVGSHIRNFNYIFNMYALDIMGAYQEHVEYVYMQRCSMSSPDKTIRCPAFPIEPTIRGGINQTFTNI